MRVPRARRVPWVAVACVTAVAACGSSAKPSSPAASAQAGSGSHSTASTLSFSKCMRANGVPSFPDLSSNGMLIEGNAQTLKVNGVSVNAPAFLAARTKCQNYLPQSHASSAQSAQQRQRGLDFSECMRSHGVPNFPDPRVVGSSGGNQRVYLPGINLQSPAVQVATKACGGGPKGP